MFPVDKITNIFVGDDLSLGRLVITGRDGIGFGIKFHPMIRLYRVIVFHARKMISFRVAVADDLECFCFHSGSGCLC